ncbi:DUF417 family protein [Chryseobacterium sp. Chry.R1]|uniref:DUF417 family protein n=1 Tax=Chryseobacterium sp. Chry.R1 TaxID=3139392 RepID=UPI0031F8D2AF
MNLNKTGYNLAVIGTITVLIWIGIFKFTPEEATAIKGYISNSFLMNWMYRFSSTQGVSNIIGSYEIVTAILLILSFWNKKVGLVAGYLTATIFMGTLSFLLTTPGIWRLSNGILITDFFVLKDIAFLAIALQIIAKHSKE